MKALTENELDAFLRTLVPEYKVLAPVALHDGTRALRDIEEGAIALAGGRTAEKPLSVFFPHYEEILALETGGDGGGCAALPERSPAVRSLIVGLTAEDAEALAFTDRFFAAHYRDQPYFSKRDLAEIVVVSGRCGPDGAFLRIAGGNCDLELISDGSVYWAVPYSDAGRKLEARMPGDARNVPLEALQHESDALPDADRVLLERASELIRAHAVPDAFWEAIADRCIACTACNMVCPACTCFDVVDVRDDGVVRRCRLWDSCQLDGFAREASGHNPLGTEGLRTRRRIHHRLVADLERWGRITCFLGGRCDEVCPSGIGMKSVAGAIVRQCGETAPPRVPAP